MYDVIVIGAGPAGLTAALYVRRANKTVLVLEKETFGGQITHSPKVENFPGTMEISGTELADKLVEQVLNQGGDIEMETVTGIRDGGAVKTVITEDGEHECRAVIIAAGAEPRKLGVAREDELVGNGVYYCAVCDGAFQKGKTVALIGGGNSALQEAMMLSEIVGKLYIIQNLAFFTGEKKMIDALTHRDNVEVIFSSVVTGLMGNDALEGIKIKNTDTGIETELPLDAIFVAIGRIPENGAFADCVELDRAGYVAAAEDCLTRTPGVFTAGDCRSKKIRQLTTAMGDGAVAACAACGYIDSL